MSGEYGRWDRVYHFSVSMYALTIIVTWGPALQNLFICSFVGFVSPCSALMYLFSLTTIICNGSSFTEYSTWFLLGR